MSKLLVFGHRNPDTDSICSALVYAYLLNHIGVVAEPVRLGDVSDETDYALRYFQAEAPRYVETVAHEVTAVALVDHNEPQQSVRDIDQVQVVRVVDHHRIHQFQTNVPLYYRAEPVGCTATILYKLFQEHHVAIDEQRAGLMLSAILSDTMVFRSPTCTEEDRMIGQKLALIARVDAEQYGMDLLRAGTHVVGKSPQQLLEGDCKAFSIGTYAVEIAQVNVVDVQDVLVNRDAIEHGIQQRIAERELQLFLFLITDIVRQDSLALVYGARASLVERAFGVTLEGNQAWLPGIVSRKSQVIPPLNEAVISTTAIGH